MSPAGCPFFTLKTSDWNLKKILTHLNLCHIHHNESPSPGMIVYSEDEYTQWGISSV